MLESGKTNLRRVTYLVMDDATRMLDMEMRETVSSDAVNVEWNYSKWTSGL